MEVDAQYASPARPELPLEKESDDAGIARRLANFQVIANPFLRQGLLYAPVILAILLLLDWLLGLNFFTGDKLRLPAVILLILELWVLRLLFEKTPGAFRSMWAQGLLAGTQSGRDPREEFLRYLKEFERLLNSRWSWLLGLVFAVGIYFTSLSGLALLGIYKGPESALQLFGIFFIRRFGFIAPLAGFLIGLMAWRVILIAVNVSRLGSQFSFNVIPNHPDACGGWSPLGDLCFYISYTLLLPAVFLSFWGLAVIYFDIPGTEFYQQNWSSTFTKLLFLLSISSLFLFFQPVYTTHLQMERRKEELDTELNHLGQQIGLLGLEIRESASAMEIEQASEKMKALEVLEKVYAKSQLVPVWPFNGGKIGRYAVAQIAPLLTLMGTSQPVVNLANSITSNLFK